MRSVLVWLLMLALGPGTGAAEPVTVYAAASLTHVLENLAQTAGKHGMAMKLSFESSSTLAKQIEAGAPADIYFSANGQWMDYLAERDLIAPGSRVNLLSNALVVIAPKGEAFAVAVRPNFDFAGAFDGRLSMGNPSHVPAGMYARQALEALGWWSALQDRMAPANDVRGALTLVERGECPAGIVYATDAAISGGVEVIATLPDSLHMPIVYPMAAVEGRHTAAVAAVMGFLQSDEAATVFKRYGFRVLGPKSRTGEADF